jgi:NADPH:quinone reductase-like Zn-dependent oxidoreductase
MPRNLDFTAAAAVPLAGLTALQALRDELGVKPGQRVFISGGAGGVVTFAIQIAKWLAAHVTTTASKRGEALLRSLGCDEVIDYTTQDISKTGRGRLAPKESQENFKKTPALRDMIMSHHRS